MPVYLEIRKEGGRQQLSGRFPYNQRTLINTGAGRNAPRYYETIRAGAFSETARDASQPLDLLVGHDFQRPIASRQSGSLKLEETREALLFEADLPDPAPSWVIDTAFSIDAKIMVGLSPGFWIENNADQEFTEANNEFHRVIKRATLRELSVVTNPAYPMASVIMKRSESGGQANLKPSFLDLWL